MPVLACSPSVPFNLTQPSPGNTKNCTFSIPASGGPFLSATWRVAGTVNGNGLQDITADGDGMPLSFGGFPGLSYDHTQAATAGQLAAINAALGGTYHAVLRDLTSGPTPLTLDTVSVFTLTVLGPGDCTFSILPTARTVDYTAHTGQAVAVTAAYSYCSWNAVSNASWLHVESGSESGTGSGSCYYSVDENPNTTSRVGTLTIAGETHTVTQTGRPDASFTSPLGGGGSAAAFDLSNQATSLYLGIGFPNGYKAGINLRTSLGQFREDSFVDCRPRIGDVNVRVVNGVLIVTDAATGVELVDGTALAGVDIWWLGNSPR